MQLWAHNLGGIQPLYLQIRWRESQYRLRGGGGSALTQEAFCHGFVMHIQAGGTWQGPCGLLGPRVSHHKQSSEEHVPTAKPARACSRGANTRNGNHNKGNSYEGILRS